MTFQTNQHAAAAAKKKKQTVSPNHEAHLVEQPNHAPSHKRGYKPSASAGSDVAATVPPVPAASEAPPVPVAMPAPMPVLNESDVNAPAPPTPQIVPPAYSVGLRNLPFVPAAATPSAAGISGFRATVPPSPAHAASSTVLTAGGHQEMVLPLSEAAPELFGGNPAAATPHYDALGAAGAGVATGGNIPASMAAPIMTKNAAGTVTPVGYANQTTGLPPLPRAAAAGGFRATVPPSPAHGASTAILGSGSHQEMVLPLSEAAPELFGGNPAASTPHYDAMAAAPTAPAAAGTAAPFVPSAPVTATPMNYATPLGGAAGLPTPVSTLPRATPSYGAAGAVPPSPSGGIRATIAPSPAHAASTAVLGSGSHQEMVLPLSEAAPELFGGNPAASTPHYDAMAAAAPAATAAPFIAAAPVTATPMNYAPAANVTPSYRAMGAVPPTPSGGLRATVAPSPAHAASTTMLGSGSHQEMVLPLSEAAPELFGGNPAASTPHYDAMAAADPAALAAGPAAMPFVSAAPVTATPVNYASAAAGGIPLAAGGLRATVSPSPAHAASTTMLGSGGHQELVLPLSEAAPELFGGNPAASTPHYDAVA